MKAEGRRRKAEGWGWALRAGLGMVAIVGWASLGFGKTVEISFVPPPMEGTISLGIYAKDGKLVRVLHREASASDFTVGLDGLITQWDGKTDAGEDAPDGTYAARGVVAGDLGVEGQAYLFNDWIADDSSPRLRRIRNIRTLSNGWLLMLAESATGELALVRCDQEGTVVWNQRLPAGFEANALAANERDQFVASGDKVVRFDLLSGRSDSWTVEGAVTALAAEESVLAVASGRKTRVYEIGNQAIVWELDSEAPVEAIAIRGEMLASILDGRVYVTKDRKWAPLEQPSLTRAIGLSLTPERKIWVIDQGADGVEVKQFSAEGEFERRLRTEKGEPSPVLISVSGDEREVYLLEQDDTRQRVRRLVLVSTEPGEGEGEATSTWQVAFSREIVSSADPTKLTLETVDGSAFEPRDEVKVRLRPNPLVKDEAEDVELKIVTDERGSVLALADGLPVRHVSETPDLKWAVIGRGPKDETVTFFQSDGAVVEEYTADRLSNMMRFDAGEFELGGSEPTPDDAAVDE